LFALFELFRLIVALFALFWEYRRLRADHLCLLLRRLRCFGVSTVACRLFLLIVASFAHPTRQTGGEASRRRGRVGDEGVLVGEVVSVASW